MVLHKSHDQSQPEWGWAALHTPWLHQWLPINIAVSSAGHSSCLASFDPPPPRLNDQIAAVVCPEVAQRQSVLQRAEVTNNRGAKPSARFTTMQLAQQKEMRLLPVTKSLYPNIAMHCVAISSSCQLCSSYDSCCRFNQDWSILGF